MMTTVHLVILMVAVTSSVSFECCKDDFCSPPLIKPKITYMDYAILVPDPEGGCFCKEYPKKYVKCFGRYSCHRIPPNMNLTLSELRILTAGIQKISKNDLAKYSILKKLDIENNNNLATIEEFAFMRLKNLVNLSISYNQNLRYLEAQTFVGLLNLRELYLLNNGFNHILDFSEALTPKYLPSLTDLNLKENNFPIINSEDFSSLQNSSLKKLNLAQCRIDMIAPDSLSYFKHLEELRIGVNIFNVENITNLLINMNENGINLKFLNLFKIGLKKVPPKNLLRAIGNSSVECLSLAGNQFEIITKDSFPPMRNLKLLDLRDVSAVNITEDAFDGLPNLKTLLLGNNKFSTIPAGARNRNLTFLDINSNARYYLTASYFTVYNKTFASMTKLNVLNLSFNTIQTIYESTFLGLSSLKILSLKKCDIFYIGSKTFSALKSLIFLDLESNYFVLSKPNPIETNLFEGLDNLNVLLLGKNNISYLTNLTFSSLKSLTHLSLNDNSLSHLDPLYFLRLISLDTLDLQKNLLTPWTRRLFYNNNNLTKFYLGNNKLTTFTSAMFDDFKNITSVDLAVNNFICDCHLFLNVEDWTFRNDKAVDIIKTIQDSKATCFPNEEPLFVYLLERESDKKCNQNYIMIIAPSVVTFFVMVAAAFLIYCYRWHLRYYLFLTKLQLIRKGKVKPRNGQAVTKNFEYDAFVSYSNEDSNFVVRLVSMLENYEPFFKLCVYERDFKIGRLISESILENVVKSRKILLVISDSYVKSQWCQWETHIAQHCNLFFKNETGEYIDDSLILIRLGPVSQKHLTPTLKYLLKTRIYLQWDDDKNKQNIFWNKLRENLDRGRGRSETPIEIYTHL